MTDRPDPMAMDLSEKRRYSFWSCGMCGYNVPAVYVERYVTDLKCPKCGANELAEFVPAADLTAAREEVERLREALEQISLGVTPQQIPGSWVYESESEAAQRLARAALDTTGEGGTDG